MTSFKPRTVSISVIILLITTIAGCARSRSPLPVDRVADGQIPGFNAIRYWEAQHKPPINPNSKYSSGCNILALSGGGSKGAFGAGYLNGWSDTGTRPQFNIVTGISTGALIAPLAFLGPEYDEELAISYTTVETKDILRARGLLGNGILPLLFSESYATTKPLQRMIDGLLTPEVFRAIAAEHAKGRRLYIGTTNIDAQRMMVWDMGAIASSDHPDARKLFEKVMLASASIPGAFPPVLFEVQIDGKLYDEMHVDGGVITGVIGYGSSLQKGLDTNAACNLYVIKNGKLDVEHAQVKRKALPIMKRSIATIMKAQAWSSMIRLRNIAKQDNVTFRYISLPENFEQKGEEMFDPKDMKRMYDLGYSIATSDKPWQKEVPLFKEDEKWLWTPPR
ncbi:Patatin [Anaerohalosphaera lusitana]|uniref:Patatin n=1 Tax=Anaerohalosphaera lusitana TaxID=1936003 RepID=A0A1U9NIV7_9BACT|nr:patatin-like phospholipase family protein [Anaerohalosphaera lusitana]AQT67678.1 Patatin [Anaerohalosphaera lusitana]